MALTLGTADLTLTATNQSIYSNMASSPVIVMKAIAANTDSASRTVTIYKVPGGGLAATGNIVVDGSGLSAFTLSPGQTLPMPLSGLVLNVGDSLQGFASVTSVVNVSVSVASP